MARRRKPDHIDEPRESASGSIPALLAMLESGDHALQDQAAAALGRMSDPAAVPELIPGLGELVTTEVLSPFSAEAAVPELIRVLRNAFAEEVSPVTQFRTEIFSKAIKQIRGEEFLAETLRIIHNDIEILRNATRTRESVPRESPEVHGQSQERIAAPKAKASQSAPSLDQKIKALFSDLPDEPGERLAAVADIYSGIRKEAARCLRPALTAALQAAATLNYDQKASLTHQVNQVLLDARLAILDPETNLPAKLKAHRPRPTSPVSTLQLQDSRAAPEVASTRFASRG